MRIPTQGRTKSEILADLQAARAGDFPFRDGKLFAYTFEGDAETTELGKAQRLLELRQPGKAAAVAHRITVREPGNAEAWLTLAASYEALGQPKDAKDAYRSCVAKAAGAGAAECKALLGE